MRIAHVTPYFTPKLGYEERYLPKKQKDLGCDVCIVTSDKYFPFPNFNHVMSNILGNRIVGNGLFFEEDVPVYRLKSIFEWGAAIFVTGMKKVLKDFDPDIVHAHHMLYPTNFLAALSKSSLGFKLVVDEHVIIDDFPRNKLKQLSYELYKKAFFLYLSKKADHYIALTPAVLSLLQREFDVDKRLITLSSLGADIEVFKQDDIARNMYRSKLGLSSDDILITYAGKLEPDKDIDVFVKGVAPLISQNPKIRILFLGGGGKAYVFRIREIAEKFGVLKNFSFHSFVDREKLSCFYNASDIGVWPGSPSITIIEAMACGLPIIIADSEQTCHLVSSNNGFSFSRGNSQEIRYFLQKLITDETLRHKMGSNSRELVEEKLSWDKIASRTIKVYERIINL